MSTEPIYKYQVLWNEDGAPRRSTARDLAAARLIVRDLNRKTQTEKRIQRRLVTPWEDVPDDQ